MTQVSIIMPVKNASKYLEACVQSILDQTYESWELIAVEDHSSDHSQAILDRFASADPRIQVVGNTGSGIIHALQLALEISCGNFITRMDADDMMPPERLNKMVSEIEDSDTHIVVTGLIKYFSDHPVSKGYRKYENWLNSTNLTGTQWPQVYRECVIASPNWMINREALVAIGSFHDLSYPEDYHLTLKWYQHQFMIKTIPEITLLWREHPERISRNSSNYNQEAFFRLKISHFIHHDLRSDPLVIWGRNEKTRLTGRILKDANVPFLLFDLNDFQLTEKLNDPQILVGVYPEKQERIKIEDYLSDLARVQGRDWWYI